MSVVSVEGCVLRVLKDGEAQSITFTWSGVDHSIDLSKANADKFVKAIGPYLEKAQRVVAARVVAPLRAAPPR